MNTRRSLRREGNLRVIPTEARELAGHLGAMPNEEIECRAGHHEFELDLWKLGQDIPQSVYARPGRDGTYELVSPCLNCGAQLIVTTGSGGRLDGDLPRRIQYPGTWYHIPSHLPRGKRLLRREKFRRGEPVIRALIRNADRTMAAERPVPAAKFQGI